MEIKEFEIPVPWGHIAVKAWGNERNTPVLMAHGWCDNAGIFDRLIPYLSTTFYYICIDLPSHGKSSHYPPYLFINAIDNVLTIKLVIDHLNRKKYIYMGHSWGGQAGILFTQLYPEYITKLVVFDSFYLYPVSLETFKNGIKEKFEGLIQINKKMLSNNKPSYTMEQAVTKLIDSRRHGKLTREAAEALVKRALVSVPDGKFTFSTDSRLKVCLNPFFDLKFIVQLVNKYPITCPVLFISASDSNPEYVLFKPVVEVMKRNKHCFVKHVEGSHDVHNNSPEIVAPIVNEFLNYTGTKSKL